MPNKTAVAEEPESRYPAEELHAQAEALFGVKPEVVAGALDGITQEEFTLGEIRKLIDNFLNRVVG